MFKSRPGKYGALCIMFNDLNASPRATLGHYWRRIYQENASPSPRIDVGREYLALGLSLAAAGHLLSPLSTSSLRFLIRQLDLSADLGHGLFQLLNDRGNLRD